MVFFQNHPIIRAITFTLLAIGLLRLIEAHSDNTVASAFGWFLVAGAVVMYLGDLVLQLDRKVGLGTVSAILLYGIGPVIAAGLAVRFLADGGLLVPFAIALVFGSGCRSWQRSVRGTPGLIKVA